ncbi:hypothetical protein KFE25_013366 [Diacronema lutheri]|uniref:Uncharacterized protein n=2 Tax=Diacronema lutheri TaxID=2081491 RepID=A0A8J5XNA8_DIALT|nr:hypothetical protein KFE25_013366 [Diacronema lutheri]
MHALLALLLGASAGSASVVGPAPLRGKVALVTGASRGIGRGIAIELGRAGAEVYVTGRSLRGSRARPAAACDDLTIERTAEEVSEAGGVGRFIRCDHADDASVSEAFARIAQEQPGLDILVNNAFSSDNLNDLQQGGLRAPFWVQGARMWDMVHNVGLRSHYVCSCEAVPLMMRRGGGLMVQVSSFGGSSYIFNVAYGVAKGAVDRLTRDMSIELRPHAINTVSLYPGLVRTERNLQLQREGMWDAESGGLDLDKGETPSFSGRATVALACAPPDMLRALSGSVQVVAELAEQFGFDDEGATRPASIRSLRFLLPQYVFPDMRKQGLPVPGWLDERVPDVKLPWAVFKGGPPQDIA